MSGHPRSALAGRASLAQAAGIHSESAFGRQHSPADRGNVDELIRVAPRAGFSIRDLNSLLDSGMELCPF